MFTERSVGLLPKKLRNKVTHSAASFLSIAALLTQEVKFALKQCVKSRGLLVASRGRSSDNGYQLRPELLRVTVLVESRGHFSAVQVVSHAGGVKMEPVKVAKVIRCDKRKDLIVINGFKFRFQKKSC